MKLLYCKSCHDIIKLDFKEKYCKCKKIGGMYVNVLDIVIVGKKKFAVPFGIHNSSFQKAISNRPKEDTGNNGEVFLSFIIPENCKKVNFWKKEDLENKEVPAAFRNMK